MGTHSNIQLNTRYNMASKLIFVSLLFSNGPQDTRSPGHA